MRDIWVAGDKDLREWRLGWSASGPIHACENAATDAAGGQHQYRGKHVNVGQEIIDYGDAAALNITLISLIWA